MGQKVDSKLEDILAHFLNWASLVKGPYFDQGQKCKLCARCVVERFMVIGS